MKKIYQSILALSLVTLMSIPAFATHVAGGDIYYENIGPNTFKITLKLFKDCNPGSATLGTTASVSIANTCGFNGGNPINLTLNLEDPLTGLPCAQTTASLCATEISQLCPSQQNQSTCNGGSLPGMAMYKYVNTIVLPGQCNTWQIGYTLGNRNCSLNLSPCGGLNGPVFYVETTLNSQTAPTDNSPIYTSQPIPYVCNGQLVSYNFGVIELDGDSLVYELDTAQVGLNTLATYNAPYTASNPLQTASGTTLNANTGQLTFTPTLNGFWVFCIIVSEYDHVTHLLKGTAKRDIQFIVQTCNNQVPVPAPTAGHINMTSGNATQTGPYSIELCEGQNFCFTIAFPDPDLTDTLSVFSNIGLALPGASFNVTGVNPAIATVCWTAPSGSALTNNSFSVTVKDDACPIIGLQTFVYDIFVSASTVASADDTICGTLTAQLNAAGGNTFNWFSISGQPIILGTNFSCNPCQNPIATPTATTTYIVVSDLTSTCFNTDTVTVYVMNTFGHTISQSAATACLNQSVQFTITPTGTGGPFTYSWSPTTGLNNPNIPNPLATFTSPGTYTYYITLTNPFGCFLVDSTIVTVAPNYPPPATATAAATQFCRGSNTTLNVLFGSGTPPSCGANLPATVGPVTTYTAGTGSDNTNFPTPFASQNNDGRLQMLFTTPELNAAGFNGGTISELKFNVVSKLSGANPFNGLTIKLACVANSSFPTSPGPASWLNPASAVVVYSGNWTTTVGLNTIPLSTQFNWDGFSNLFVEICFDNSANSGGSDVVSKTVTSYRSAMYVATNAGAPNNSGCSISSISPTSVFLRPNIGFGTVPYPLNLSNLNINWIPAANVTNATIANPGTLDTATIVHTLQVTNTTNGCVTLDTILITVNDPKANAGNDFGICAGNTGTLNGSGINITGYAWTPVGNLSNPAIANPVINPFNATQDFYLHVTDGFGCTDDDTVHVTYNLNPIASFTGLPDTLCSTAFPVQLTGSPAGGFFTGTGLAFLNPDWFFSPSGLTGIVPIQYNYQDLTTQCIDDTIINITVLPFNGGVPINFTMNPASPFCIDAGVSTLVPSQAGGTFSGPGVTGTTFNPAAAGAGSHVLTFSLTDGNLCTGTYTQTVVVNNLPTVSITNLSDKCINSGSFTLTGSPSGGTFTIDGSTASVYDPAGLGLGSHTVVYTYTTTTAPLCTNSITQTASVVALPVVDAVTVDSICSGTSIALHATGASNYSWSPSTSLTGATTADPVASPSSTQMYTVTGYTAGPPVCSSTDQVAVVVMPTPTVSITANPATGTVPLNVTFASSAANADFYAWNFGEGGTSTLANPTYTYDSRGTFLVICNVENFNHRCTASDSLVIETKDSVIIKQFNVFTPNGDGDNDLFFVKAEGLSDITVDIFNRWGRKVGEYSGVNNGWDGKVKNGKLADDGVYFYVANAVGPDGTIYKDLKGFFQLIQSTSIK